MCVVPIICFAEPRATARTPTGQKRGDKRYAQKLLMVLRDRPGLARVSQRPPEPAMDGHEPAIAGQDYSNLASNPEIFKKVQVLKPFMRRGLLLTYTVIREVTRRNIQKSAGSKSFFALVAIVDNDSNPRSNPDILRKVQVLEHFLRRWLLWEITVTRAVTPKYEEKCRFQNTFSVG